MFPTPFSLRRAHVHPKTWRTRDLTIEGLAYSLQEGFDLLLSRFKRSRVLPLGNKMLCKTNPPITLFSETINQYARFSYPEHLSDIAAE